MGILACNIGCGWTIGNNKIVFVSELCGLADSAQWQSGMEHEQKPIDSGFECNAAASCLTFVFDRN